MKKRKIGLLLLSVLVFLVFNSTNGHAEILEGYINKVVTEYTEGRSYETYTFVKIYDTPDSLDGYKGFAFIYNGGEAGDKSELLNAAVSAYASKSYVSLQFENAPSEDLLSFHKGQSKKIVEINSKRDIIALNLDSPQKGFFVNLSYQDYLSNLFDETLTCFQENGHSDYIGSYSSLVISLREPAFDCKTYTTNTCGGIFQRPNKIQISNTYFFKEEVMHYLFNNNEEGDMDGYHESPLFNSCY